MRKAFLSLALLILAGSLTAQQKARFSLMVNPTVSWFTSDLRDTKPSGTFMGFDAGIAADIFFSENYAVTTGVSIGTIGGNLSYKDTTSFELNTGTVAIPGGTAVKYNLQYLNIPLGIKMKSIEIGYITYYAQAGLNANFLIAARGTSNDPNYLLDKDNIIREANFLNLGYHIGGGLEYSIGSNNAIVFGVMYNHGFLDITKPKTDNIRYQSVMLRIGFLF